MTERHDNSGLPAEGEALAMGAPELTTKPVDLTRPGAHPVQPNLAAAAGPGGSAAVQPPNDPAPAHRAVEPGPGGVSSVPAASADVTAPSEGTASAARRGLFGRRVKRKMHRKAPWWELPALVALAILIAILVKTFVVQPFYIPSASMEPTLHGCPGCHGDRILVNKPIYDFRDPHPGDIVVFHAPPGWDDEAVSTPPSNPIVRVVRGFGQLIGFVPPDGQVLVKRVIAVGGQTIKGDSTGKVMVSDHGSNGPYRTLNERYTLVDPGQQSNLRAFGPVTIPQGRLWVMGDHRNDSADSRYHCGAGASDTTVDSNCNPMASTVPVGDVIGKAFVIAWPPSRWRTLGTPTTFQDAALSLGGALPGAVSALTVLPLYVLRRRGRGQDRRSRRRRRSR